MNEISHLKKILTILNFEDMFRILRIHYHFQHEPLNSDKLKF